MKLRPRHGLPLLAAVLLSSAFIEPPWRLVLLVVAMGLALWTAFSLPHPGANRDSMPDEFGLAPPDAEEVDPEEELVPEAHSTTAADRKI